MIIETLELGAIFVCCGLLSWSALKKYHSNIEIRLEKIENHSTELKVIEKIFKK
jgi:hypothetical protein